MENLSGNKNRAKAVTKVNGKEKSLWDNVRSKHMQKDLMWYNKTIVRTLKQNLNLEKKLTYSTDSKKLKMSVCLHVYGAYALKCNAMQMHAFHHAHSLHIYSCTVS